MLVGTEQEEVMVDNVEGVETGGGVVEETGVDEMLDETGAGGAHGFVVSNSFATYRLRRRAPPQVCPLLPLQGVLQDASATERVPFPRTVPHQHSPPNSVPAKTYPLPPQVFRQSSVVMVEASSWDWRVANERPSPSVPSV